MNEQANFSIFHRRPAAMPPPAPEPAVAAPLEPAPTPISVAPPEPIAASPAPDAAPIEPEPVPAAPPGIPAPSPEPAAERPTPPFQQAELPTVNASADQLGLANPSVITMVASLPDEEPAALTSKPTGVYRAVGDTLPAPPPAGPAVEAAEAQTGLVRGTRILTAIGEIAVELLVLGDAALALRGPALLPIEWIGRTAAATRAIRIEAGALGRNIPRRPLSLAPGHPVFIDPVPVPACTLVNGSTIQAIDMEETELFQIDVGAPEVLFAEGVPLSSHLREALGEQPSHLREALGEQPSHLREALGEQPSHLREGL